MTPIGINGFGRMGRLALRAAWGGPDLEFVHVNELARRRRDAAHLLDVRLGPRPLGPRASAATERRARRSTARRSRYSGARRTRATCLGGARRRRRPRVHRASFRTPESLAPYFERGVKKVIVAAPVKDERALNVVVGVNDDLYDPAEHDIVTAASCTTNCLAPVVKVIHEGIGIRRGSITTLHDITNTQTIVDAPHKDLRRARAASLSLIPTTTGSATAIGLIFPELQGKLDGLAVRVPLLNASLTDCVFEVARADDASRRSTRCCEAAADGPLAGHPRLRGAAARLGRLQGRPALGDRRRALDDGHRRDAGEDPRLVRQRVGLREPAGRARRDGRARA